MQNGNNENHVFYAAIVRYRQTRFPTRRVTDVAGAEEIEDGLTAPH